MDKKFTTYSFEFDIKVNKSFPRHLNLIILLSFISIFLYTFEDLKLNYTKEQDDIVEKLIQLLELDDQMGTTLYKLNNNKVKTDAIMK